VRACNSLSLSLSLTGEQGAYTLFTGQREREKEGYIYIKREREREREREGEKERKSKKEGGRKRERCRKFLEGITGALAPFSYLIYQYKLT
jgi:hypothetical protein